MPYSYLMNNNHQSAKMVNIKVEDDHEDVEYTHMFGSSDNTSPTNHDEVEAEIMAYSFPDMDQDGNLIFPDSSNSRGNISSSSSPTATSPRRTTPARKCRERQLTTVSPDTTNSTSDMSIQDSFINDYEDMDYDKDWKPKKQSPRNKNKKKKSKASSPRGRALKTQLQQQQQQQQQPRKARTATTIRSATPAEVDQDLGYHVQVGRDVLCGRGQKIKVLNEHYREIIRQHYPPYVLTKNDDIKRDIAKKVYSLIVDEKGGRFLDINGVELEKSKAVLKVMKALKDAKKQHAVKPNKSRSAAAKMRSPKPAIRATAPVLRIRMAHSAAAKMRSPKSSAVRAATPVHRMTSPSASPARSSSVHFRSRNVVTPPIKPKPIKKKADDKMVEPLPLVIEPLPIDDNSVPLEDDSFMETLNWLACMDE